MADKEDPAYVGPYKATKVWNEVIEAFRQYLPCGRHRRYMKTFDNCFSGAGAIEWLLQYLKTNASFSSDISRSKAASLVNKIYSAGIFEEVQVTKSMRHKSEVQENRLYRFLPASPSKVKIPRLPLAPRQDASINQNQLRSIIKERKESKDSIPKRMEQSSGSHKDVTKEDIQKPSSRLTRKLSILKKEKAKKNVDPENEEGINYPPCHIVTRILTTKEIKDTWKAVFTSSLKKVLGRPQLGDVVDSNLIDGYNVMHNCIYLNKSGVVTNIDSSEQLPHWVMSAMKCLAHWPEPAEPGLPNYPGFEKDVFGVVRDYFVGLEDPLVPGNLYHTFRAVFLMCSKHRKENVSSPWRDEEVSEECPTIPSSLWTSASLENIILNLTRKYCTLDADERSSYFNSGKNMPPLRNSEIPFPEQTRLFASQEDIRFTSQLDSHLDYNRSAYPSTDGMDRIIGTNLAASKSMGALAGGLSMPQLAASQNSCTNLPRLGNMKNLLSKTTQSEKQPDPASRKYQNLKGRAYRSTPNLKVSKYETAFAPDNRTVTRVFYQNGFTADVSHDDAEDAIDVLPSSLKEEHTEMNDCLIDECVLANQGISKNGHYHEPKSSFARSNSVLGLRGEHKRVLVEKKRNGVYANGSLDRSVTSKQGHRNDFNKADDLNLATPAKMNLSIGETITMPLSAVNLNKDDVENTLQKLQNSSPGSPFNHKLANSPTESLMLPSDSQYPCVRRKPSFVSSVQRHRSDQGVSTPRSAIVTKVPQPAIFYPTTEERTSMKRVSQPKLLSMFGPGYRSPGELSYVSPKSTDTGQEIANTNSDVHLSRPLLKSCSNMRHANSAEDLLSPVPQKPEPTIVNAKKQAGLKHTRKGGYLPPSIHPQISTTSLQNVKRTHMNMRHINSVGDLPAPILSRVSMSSLHDISDEREAYPDDKWCPGLDKGYRPVLDASKERKSVSRSSSSLLDQREKDISHTSNSQFFSAGRSNSHCDVSEREKSQLTCSTPVSSSLGTSGVPYLSIGRCPPSRISPNLSLHPRYMDNSNPREFLNYPQTRLSEDRARNTLQLVSLLLPPANRRKLHLLFKLMVKMAANPNLCLDPTQTTRSLVLSTFYKTILRCPENQDEMVVLQLVSFMLDFYAEIFCPPVGIKSQVSERLKQLQTPQLIESSGCPQVVFSPRPDRAVRFCEQVSTAEFENQRRSDSQTAALEGLLEGIIRNENMGLKEKKRRLKQFQRIYPAIYTRRFPTAESEAYVLPPQKPKIRQPLSMKPLNKLKGLRL